MTRTTAILLILLLLGSPCWAQSDKGDRVRIYSDSLRIMDQTGVVLFEGNVRVQLAEATLTCEKLTIRTSDQNPSQVLFGTAVGSVIMERGQERVEAGEAHFDLEKATVDLTGSPSLIKGLTTIRAERITYMLDEGTAVFDGPVKAVFMTAGE